MKKTLLCISLVAIHAFSGYALAQSREAIAQSGSTVAPGQEMHLATRGHDATYYAVWRPDAIATVVLFSGGGGGYGHVAPSLGNWPSSNNYLVRSARVFAGKPLNVVVYGASDDMPKLTYPDRLGNDHQTDIKNLLTTIKVQSPAPIWLIGTSRGTLSSAEATVRYQGSLVSGVILTSSVTAGRHETVYSSDLAAIKVPTMVMYHVNDTCAASSAGNASSIERSFKNASDKKTVAISGGDPGTGDVCEGLASHGYPGKEQETVAIMTDWIRTHPPKVGEAAK
jgi:hypothetical protein